MCGINGIVNLPISDGSSAVIKMNESLQHRGPDASGVFNHNAVHLGHQRLSIIDLSASANQPFHLKNTATDDHLIMVYNGEIYNYQELQKKHELTCKTSSDTEVILKAYAKIGTAIFSELNGMFALAIYNVKDQSLCLARDRMGIKPLYLYRKENGLAFSSELNALKSVKEIAQEFTLNKQSVASFLHLGYIPAPLSIYQQVSKFPAGSFAIFKEGQLETKQFWKLENQISKELITDKKQALQQLDDLLNESVRLRLKCDVPFGTFLSGGIDSSIITAIAQQNSSRKINSFSIGFKEKTHNEAVFAQQVANKLGTNHQEFIVSEKEALNIVPEMFSSYGEPYADSSAIPTMMVSKLARSEVKMTLSGDGGDELFHGYGFYNWVKRLNQPLIKAFKQPIAAILSQGNLRMQRAAHLFNYPKNALQSHVFSQEQYFFSSLEVKNLMGENFKDLPAELNHKTTGNRLLTAAETQSIFDLKYYLKDELLTKVDIASMQKSLEVRVPLLDHNVVEFALNLHPSLKIKNGVQKYLLKELLYEYLPKNLFDRPKQGFSVPLANWLKADLNHLITDYLNQKTIESHGLVNWNIVKDLTTRFYNGENYLYTRIWALIVLHHWLSTNEFKAVA